jgi:7-cyano-7-deazaguanine synthase
MSTFVVKPDVVVVFSGGIDSATVLVKALEEGKTVAPFTLDYGQRHIIELSRGAELLSSLHDEYRDQLLPRKLFSMPNFAQLVPGGSQTDSSVPVPHGHYEEESMKKTVVPNRNMIIISLATAYAISLQAKAVWYGAHRGDHAIYPDCRKEFVDALKVAVGLADWHMVTLKAPFVAQSKAGIVGIGERLAVPWKLTYSCYEGGPVHCGKCGTCQERQEAFRIAAVKDPTEYEP